MSIPIWTTVLQPEPRRLPNNGSKTIAPTVYEWSGRVVVDSQDLAYFIGVAHDRLLQAWDRVMLIADRPWKARHYLPLTERYGMRGGKPFHERDVRLTQEATEAALAIFNKKKTGAAVAIFEGAAARGTVIREESRKLSDLIAAMPAKARARIEQRQSDKTNCAAGDEAQLTVEDERWRAVRFEVIRATTRHPDGYGPSWECHAFGVDERGGQLSKRVPAFDVARQEWSADRFVTIPDSLLNSITAAEDVLLAREGHVHA